MGIRVPISFYIESLSNRYTSTHHHHFHHHYYSQHRFSSPVATSSLDDPARIQPAKWGGQQALVATWAATQFTPTLTASRKNNNTRNGV